MDFEKVVRRIEIHKNNPCLKFRLKSSTEHFTDQLYMCLFDEETAVAQHLERLEGHFKELIALSCWKPTKSADFLWVSYLEMLPEILETLNLDARAISDCDPASQSIQEVYMAYPGFYAIAIYRLAHQFHLWGFPLVPRLMTEYAHSKTGVDINPGAIIGKSFFIDHGTGVVIGETTCIKDKVKIYQGVTLGALYVEKELRQTKRHPTIENGVTIYANATILGGKTVIGANSIIGGNAWVTESVPPNSKVFHTPEIKIKTQNES
jgi:serine O-acetyltransferase